jgi:hypothetical protein
MNIVFLSVTTHSVLDMYLSTILHSHCHENLKPDKLNYVYNVQVHKKTHVCIWFVAILVHCCQPASMSCQATTSCALAFVCMWHRFYIF